MANVKSEYMKLYPAHAGFSTKTVNNYRAYDRPDIDLPAKIAVKSSNKYINAVL